MELIYHFISTDFKSNHKCRMTAVAKPLGYYMSYHIAVSKNSPYTELLNEELCILFIKAKLCKKKIKKRLYIYSFMLYYMQSGLVNHMRQKTSRSDNPCRVDVKPTGNMSAFKLKDFAFSFFFFGIGIAFSLALFLLELLTARANGIMTKKNEKSPKIIVVMPVHSV